MILPYIHAQTQKDEDPYIYHIMLLSSLKQLFTIHSNRNISEYYRLQIWLAVVILDFTR